jgi:hypothetical protein
MDSSYPLYPVFSLIYAHVESWLKAFVDNKLEYEMLYFGFSDSNISLNFSIQILRIDVS